MKNGPTDTIDKTVVKPNPSMTDEYIGKIKLANSPTHGKHITTMVSILEDCVSPGSCSSTALAIKGIEAMLSPAKKVIKQIGAISLI